MSLIQETRVLREKVAAWGADPEWALLCRYDLLRDKTPPSLAERWFRQAQKLLAGLGLISPHVTKYSWLPTLEHAQQAIEAQVLLIWALDLEQDALRAACDGFKRRLGGNSGMVPVLVTDTADFAYFSRLQWLVEYVPNLSGDGESFRARKVRYLAWRYRGAVVVPASAGTAAEEEWREVMEMEC